MRLLLDACVPRGLAKHLSGYRVSTAHEMGWGDLDNGDLLDAMTSAFDVLVTVDRGIPKQQHIAGRPLAVLVLRAKSNRIIDLLPLIPEAQRVLGLLERGSVAIVG